ncbi:MAG: hypothetical protein MUC48_26760 [Leptolyngbya sp. Prado105]|nr:hypothetical protein [Leptolyngbya sp. Prado105]
MSGNRAQILDRYRKLVSPKRQIVQLFAVIFEPISRATFLDCLNHAGITEDGKPFSAAMHLIVKITS